MKKKRNSFKLIFDRALSNSIGKQILFLMGVLLVTFWVSFGLLSASGVEWINYCNEFHINKFVYPLYLLIDDNAFNGLYTSEHGQSWQLLISGITYVIGSLVFAGMLIGIISNAIDKRVENHRKGHIHYLKSGHYIIMGYDELVPSFIAEIFAKKPDADVLILTSVDAEVVYEKLEKSVAGDKLDKIIVNYGQRTSKDYYKDIYLENAEEIFIVGKRSLPAHDAINIECVDNICNYLCEKNITNRPKQITCVFEDVDTYTAFKTTEIFNKVHELGIDFMPYNFYSGWAKQVFVARSYREKNNPSNVIDYPSVYGDGISLDDRKNVHLVFVGASSLSESFATEAAQLLHFPNFSHDEKTRTLITFIDENADQEMTKFVTRNRNFFEVQSYRYRDLTGDSEKDEVIKAELEKESKTDLLDVTFEFIKGDVFSKKVQQELSQWAVDDGQYLSVFLAMTDQRNNFAMAMNMPNAVYDKGIPVFIRQDRADNFVTNLRRADQKDFDYAKVVDGKLTVEKRQGRYANLYPFGMNDLAYCTDDISLKRAKLINYLYSTADYGAMKFTSVEELAKIPAKKIWEDADNYWKPLSIANKWSSIYCADNIPCKLASLKAMGYSGVLEESQMMELAITEHNRWTVEKLLMGFRMPHPEEDKYAHPEFAKELGKNKKLFIHHDIKPYEDLDIVRNLDYEIVKVIPWIVEMTR